MAKHGAEMTAKLRELADWIESEDGQDYAEDKDCTDESWPRTVIAEMLHFCDDKDWRADQALFYGWLRFHTTLSPDERYPEFNQAIWKTTKIVDKEK